ncbi:uncharacterized protein TM35_000481330 [Trypanosoma theileri]|uniref:Uncharacterized protein n=1 Tax=Trypanosoma theileri TaxID=67003 RepID=A0A1X0NHB7_9TRYP|nr:uncharacterized protein TM35_000481330 [Trypanosoma theileri]ORC84172.1 hypothetical protein TM35_000481330 [Trypanosoma theileri]
MPGREVTIRTVSTSRERRPAGSPFAGLVGSTKQKQGKQQEQQQQQKQKQEVCLAPACESCLKLLQCSQKVRRALEDVLINAKMVFLDDTLHHQMDDERWLRILRAIGEDKTTYYTRMVPIVSIKSATDGKGL